MTRVVVFGGTGFLGQQVVKGLAEGGAAVRVAVRHDRAARNTLRAAGLDQVTVWRADLRDRGAVAAAVAGAEAVVDAVSAYVEKAGVTFAAIHEQGAATLAREAAAAGAGQFVLVSGLGADPGSTSRYIAARGRGEQVVRRAFGAADIVRPGPMFGPGDALFNTLADLARLSPVLPLIGGGRTRLQPVHVDDVAQAIVRLLTKPGPTGRTYELAGPGVYSLRDLALYTLRLVGRRRLLLPVPLAVAKIQARLFELLPSPPLTTGQVDLLRTDAVVSGNLPGFRELGIEPRRVEEIVPTYIGRSK